MSSFSTVNKIFFNGGLKYRHLNQTLIVCFFVNLDFIRAKTLEVDTILQEHLKRGICQSFEQCPLATVM